MKTVEEVDVKHMKEAVKALNESGLLKKKIKVVGTSNKNMLDEFVDSIDKLPEDTDFPTIVASFYNDLFPAEENGDAAEVSEDDDTDPSDDLDAGDDIEEIIDENGDDKSVDTPDPEPEPEPVKEKPKADKKSAKKDAPKAKAEPKAKVEPKPEPKPAKKDAPKADKKPLVREKSKPEPKEKKPSLMAEKRSKVNPKLSMVKKVTNILNFSGQGYKQTAYFPLDCETVKILNNNVGLYPTEVYQEMKKDKKVMKRLESFSDDSILREINKIKSAYSYIVGAIKEDKVESKFHLIMESLMAGKEISPDVAHPTTVKVARRAILAYLEVAGIDYSVFKDARKQLVKKASKKSE